MARIKEPTPEQERVYREWLVTRPEPVRSVIEQFDIWSLYRLKSTGHRVTIASFSEHKDGYVTLVVNVTGRYNAVMFERQVFGVNPDQLEPCELPGPDEEVGVLLTPEQVSDNIDVLRVMALPNMWVLDANGKAVRKQ